MRARNYSNTDADWVRGNDRIGPAINGGPVNAQRLPALGVNVSTMQMKGHTHINGMAVHLLGATDQVHDQTSNITLQLLLFITCRHRP